jgi:rod shape-determining protein MreC
VTSGLDGIFSPGLPGGQGGAGRARYLLFSFARIYCEPVAGVENFGEVMVMDPKETTPSRPS